MLFCSVVKTDEAHDHPLVSVHPDAVIKHYIQKRYDRYESLEGPLEASDCCTLDSEKTQMQTLDGKVTRIVY